MKDLKRFGDRDSIYMDPINDEGFGDLERERLRERDLERFGELEVSKISVRIIGLGRSI